MTSRPRTQLILALERESQLPPVAHPPGELMQALADLLLEALGTATSSTAAGRDRRDEPEDHA